MAAPTSQNNVTARKLASTITGVWNKIMAYLGTAATKDAPSSGNASSTQVVMGNDTRLTDARTPIAHVHNTDANEVTSNSTNVDVVTDNTEFVTSNINGYSSTGKQLYRRPAKAKIWPWIKGLLSSESGVNVSGSSSSCTGNSASADYAVSARMPYMKDLVQNATVYGWHICDTNVNGAYYNRVLRALVVITKKNDTNSSNKPMDFYGILEINHRMNAATPASGSESKSARLTSLNAYCTSDARGYAVYAIRGSTSYDIKWYIGSNPLNSDSNIKLDYTSISVFPLTREEVTIDWELTRASSIIKNMSGYIDYWSEKRVAFKWASSPSVGSSSVPIFVDSNGEFKATGYTADGSGVGSIGYRQYSVQKFLQNMTYSEMSSFAVNKNGASLSTSSSNPSVILSTTPNRNYFPAETLQRPAGDLVVADVSIFVDTRDSSVPNPCNFNVALNIQGVGVDFRSFSLIQGWQGYVHCTLMGASGSTLTPSSDIKIVCTGGSSRVLLWHCCGGVKMIF